MDSLKYLKYKESEYSSLSQLVIFLPIDSHEDMARKLKIPQDRIISAGFFACDPESIECYGKSISLQKQSSPNDDKKKLQRAIRGY